MKAVALTSAMALALAVTATPGLAQQSGLELYHVQFVKAAPGKLAPLVDAYLKMPADPKSAEPPVILRHAQGSDWHLLVIQPLGKETTLVAGAPDAATQQFNTQIRGLTVWHGDTFTQGPPWAEARKALLGDNQPESVYIVTTFEPVPGQRAELLAALQTGPQADAANTLILHHREGAPWQLLTVTRYGSWTDLGARMQKQRGTAAPTPPTAEHTAAHSDTIVERVTAPIR